MSSNKDHFVQIGQVLKSNGTDGQVIISLSGIDAEDIIPRQHTKNNKRRKNLKRISEG